MKNNNEEKYGYYSGNTNILQTLVDCSIDTLPILYKGTCKFCSWLFDGWITPKEEKIEYDFDILWKELKLNNSIGNIPIKIKEHESENNITYMFTVPTGLSIYNFKKYENEIAQFLHCELKNLKVELINNLVGITVFKDTGKVFNYEDYKFQNNKKKDISIPLGMSLKNHNIVYWNPQSPNECHLLIAGSTGGGKSTYSYVILSHLIKNYKNIELYIQDVKLVDMWLFKDASQVVRYNQSTDYAEETTELLVNEMEKRYNYLLKYNCRCMNELDAKHKLKTIFYIVEELASFNRKKNKIFYDNLALILEKGRAVNIVIICITQTPYCEILPGELKSNFPTILGLRTRTGEASKVISNDFKMLTNLRGKGHGMFLTPTGDYEIQGFDIQKETIEDIVKNS